MANITNKNSVSIKNYSETLDIIKELKKLGIFKSLKIKKRKIRLANDDKNDDNNDDDNDDEQNNNKQESDTMSFTTPIFTKINQDMTQSQIEDIQRKQAVEVATLREQLKQQRLEDVKTVERAFRSVPQLPYDPFASQPDINKTTFSGGINEGAPVVQNRLPTTVFAEEEQLPEDSGLTFIPPVPRIKPREPIEKKIIFPKKRNETVSKLGLPPVPKQRDATKTQLEEYLKSLYVSTNRPVKENLKSKTSIFDEIYGIIDEESENK